MVVIRFYNQQAKNNKTTLSGQLLLLLFVVAQQKATAKNNKQRKNSCTKVVLIQFKYKLGGLFDWLVFVVVAFFFSTFINLCINVVWIFLLLFLLCLSCEKSLVFVWRSKIKHLQKEGLEFIRFDSQIKEKEVKKNSKIKWESIIEKTQKLFLEFFYMVLFLTNYKCKFATKNVDP